MYNDLYKDKAVRDESYWNWKIVIKVPVIYSKCCDSCSLRFECLTDGKLVIFRKIWEDGLDLDLGAIIHCGGKIDLKLTKVLLLNKLNKEFLIHGRTCVNNHYITLPLLDEQEAIIGEKLTFSFTYD